MEQKRFLHFDLSGIKFQAVCCIRRIKPITIENYQDFFERHNKVEEDNEIFIPLYEAI